MWRGALALVPKINPENKGEVQHVLKIPFHLNIHCTDVLTPWFDVWCNNLITIIVHRQEQACLNHTYIDLTVPGFFYPVYKLSVGWRPQPICSTKFYGWSRCYDVVRTTERNKQHEGGFLVSVHFGYLRLISKQLFDKDRMRKQNCEVCVQRGVCF